MLPSSADLEITVPMLVQIDKLVQLIESPVFTCACGLLSSVTDQKLTNNSQQRQISGCSC